MLDRLMTHFQGADSTRTTIALAFTAAMIYGFVVDKIGGDVFVAPASLAIGFFFNRQTTPTPPSGQ